jgi:hypothetical protein
MEDYGHSHTPTSYSPIANHTRVVHVPLPKLKRRYHHLAERAPLEKLIEKNPCLLWIPPNIHYHVHKNLPLASHNSDEASLNSEQKKRI